MGVLAQVRTGLEEEPVGVFRRAVVIQVRRARLVIGVSARPGNFDFLHERLGKGSCSGKWLREVGGAVVSSTGANGIGRRRARALLASGRDREHRANAE